MDILGPGDQVQFAKPLEAGDEAAVMTVLEDRGERVLVTDNRFADWTTKPTAVYLKSELVRLNRKER